MQLEATIRNPVPSGAAVGCFRARDGTELRYATWRPTAKPQMGTVCVFAGRAECIEKYFEVVAELRRRGFGVAIMDWRGQGGSGRPLSDPRKGHVDDFGQYDSDLSLFMREIVLPDCHAPFFALGHSTGGNILLRAATSRRWFERMVLVAPMIEFAPTRTPATLIKIGVELAAFLGLGDLYLPGASREPVEQRPFEGNPLTSDRDRYMRTREIFIAAPRLALGGPTIGWLHAALRSMAMIGAIDYPFRVRVPVLIIGAGNDVIVSTRAIEEFAVQLKAGHHVTLAGANHEILMERDDIRAQFWAAFDTYIPGGTP